MFQRPSTSAAGAWRPSSTRARPRRGRSPPTPAAPRRCTPSCRSATSRRCLVPASAICEWTGPTGKKTRHTIARADGAPLFIAGLWADHAHEGEHTQSYTMVMIDTAPGDDLHPFHNRQPVILDRPAAHTWLDPRADYREVLKAPPAGTLVADPPEAVAVG
ncbi:SOS response-associated peptidase family protein [Phenylobacterium kunshanense]|nr:SOS response-associated peptidase family protein [Phenylobacterium kunshanense]